MWSSQRWPGSSSAKNQTEDALDGTTESQKLLVPRRRVCTLRHADTIVYQPRDSAAALSGSGSLAEDRVYATYLITLLDVWVREDSLNHLTLGHTNTK